MNYPITVWRYRDAPLELQISENGGDEDWLAEVPPEFIDEWIGWMDRYTSFGYFCVDEHDHPTKPGWKVRIGCHG